MRRNPTPDESLQNEILQNITWPTVNSGTNDNDFLYLDIDEDLVVKSHPKNSSYGRWTELYDNLGYDDFDTY